MLSSFIFGLLVVEHHASHVEELRDFNWVNARRFLVDHALADGRLGPTANTLTLTAGAFKERLLAYEQVQVQPELRAAVTIFDERTYGQPSSDRRAATPASAAAHSCQQPEGSQVLSHAVVGAAHSVPDVGGIAARRMLRIQQLCMARAAAVRWADTRVLLTAEGSKDNKGSSQTRQVQRLLAHLGPDAGAADVLRAARLRMARHQAEVQRKRLLLEDVMARHAPWAALAMQLPASERLWVLQLQLCKLARLR